MPSRGSAPQLPFTHRPYGHIVTIPRSQLYPVLLGGLFTGVLSELPIVAIGNCCCLWVVGGGLVTVYLIQRGSLKAIQFSEGALDSSEVLLAP